MLSMDPIHLFENIKNSVAILVQAAPIASRGPRVAQGLRFKANEMDERSEYHKMIGWSVVALAAVSAWLLGSWRAEARRPKTRTAAAQTDAIEAPPVVLADAIEAPTVVVVERLHRTDAAKVYMTKSGEKFHISKACAQHRTVQPVREIERCLVCAPIPV